MKSLPFHFKEFSNSHFRSCFGFVWLKPRQQCLGYEDLIAMLAPPSPQGSAWRNADLLTVNSCLLSASLCLDITVLLLHYSLSVL